MHHKSRLRKLGIYSMINARTSIEIIVVYSFYLILLPPLVRKVNCVSHSLRGVSLCLFYTNREKRLFFYLRQTVAVKVSSLRDSWHIGEGENL